MRWYMNGDLEGACMGKVIVEGTVLLFAWRYWHKLWKPLFRIAHLQTVSFLRAKQGCWPLSFIQLIGHHLRRSDENDYDFEWLVGKDLGRDSYGLFVGSVIHMDTLNKTVICRHQHGWDWSWVFHAHCCYRDTPPALMFSLLVSEDSIV